MGVHEGNLNYLLVLFANLPINNDELSEDVLNFTRQIHLLLSDQLVENYQQHLHVFVCWIAIFVGH